MKQRAIVLSVILPSVVVGLVGCDRSGQASAGNPPTNTVSPGAIVNNTAMSEPSNVIPANKTTVTANATSTATGSTAPIGNSFGWRYVEFPKSLGDSPQIGGVLSEDGKIQLVVITSRTSGAAIQSVDSTVTYQPETNQLSSSGTSVGAPQAYAGLWKLNFGTMNGHRPVSMTLVGSSTSISIPSSIPAFMSEINPMPSDPASFDNQILGQTGDWVWIAMKGPEDPPIPQLVWGYRQWDRILAVDTKTRAMQVFSIPKQTSPTDTWGTTPGFGVIGKTVYIGTGNWLGAFPVKPSDQTTVPVLVPEPESEVAADQAAMLKTLADMETQGASGIVGFWNNYVMKGDQNAVDSTWIGNPAIYNHGDYPTELYWALNFPLAPGSEAYQARSQLIEEIQQLIRSSLTMTWIAYPQPALMKSHFHSTPPTAVPGYKVVSGYYVKS